MRLFLQLMLCMSSALSIAQIPQSAAIDQIFTDWSKPETPGASLGIIKDGKLVYAKGYGMANLEYDIPNTPTSVFRIGSTSKQFTAACIVLLAQQGKLSLEDTLESFFPEFPAYAQKITVRHLLNHTSGIRDYLQLTYLKGFGDDDFYTDAILMDMLVAQTDLNFEPGDEFTYSNSGYWLLGQIVEKASGLNMAEYAEKEIFKPLGMMNTHFHNDHTGIVKNRASGYVPNREGGYRISMTTLDMIGDGGIFTAIEDIKKWDDAFYNSEILNQDFWKVMTTQGKLNNGEEIDYAAGLFIEEYKGLKEINHGGAFVGFRAELLRFPEQKLSIALFANRGDANPSAMAYQIADILLKDQFKETKKETEEEDTTDEVVLPVTKIELNQLIGAYQMRPGFTITISEKDGKLNALQSWNESSYVIQNTKDNTYQIPDDTTIDFIFSDVVDGFTQTMTVIQNGRTTIARRTIPFDSSKVNFDDYLGTYYSKELDVNYTVTKPDASLRVHIENQEPLRMTITDTDQFSTPLGLMRFQRSGDGISGFELDSGRVVKLRFERE